MPSWLPAQSPAGLSGSWLSISMFSPRSHLPTGHPSCGDPRRPEEGERLKGRQHMDVFSQGLCLSSSLLHRRLYFDLLEENHGTLSLPCPWQTLLINHHTLFHEPESILNRTRASALISLPELTGEIKPTHHHPCLRVTTYINQ